ncbi:MAG: YcgN family cysteine cluster protein [Gammaproteobacteria bacterium]|jgi:uncharacterized protein
MKPFWQDRPLTEFTEAEWESLCDGCGKCCLHKLQDEADDRIYYTDVACRLLDLHSCRCTDYSRRFNRVPDCMQVSPSQPEVFEWLPVTCAYRLLWEGRDLPDWHPLRTGNPLSTHEQGHGICGRACSELDVDDIEEHIVEWVE